MLNDLIDKLPDGRAENALVNEIRFLTEREKEAVIESILLHHSDKVRGSVLRIIPRAVKDTSVLIRFLDRGLEKKTVNGAIFWIKATVGGLGYKRLLNHLKEIAERDPEWIVHAWYHLPPLVRRDAPEYMQVLETICAIVDASVTPEQQDFWQRNKAAAPL